MNLPSGLNDTTVHTGKPDGRVLNFLGGGYLPKADIGAPQIFSNKIIEQMFANINEKWRKVYMKRDWIYYYLLWSRNVIKGSQTTPFEQFCIYQW